MSASLTFEDQWQLANHGSHGLSERWHDEQAQPLASRLYMRAMSLTARDHDDAKDLVQDTLLRAVRFWHTFRQGSNFSTWMFTILRNTFINGYHRRKRRKTFETEVSWQVRTIGATVAIGHAMETGEDPEDLMAGYWSGETHDESARRIKIKAAVHRALSKMTPEQRVAVTLCDLEGFSYKEIAARIGRPVGTVMSRIHRGRKRLHELLYEDARALDLVRVVWSRCAPSPDADSGITCAHEPVSCDHNGDLSGEASGALASFMSVRDGGCSGCPALEELRRVLGSMPENKGAAVQLFDSLCPGAEGYHLELAAQMTPE